MSTSSTFKKPIWNFNLIFFFDFHNISPSEIKYFYIKNFPHSLTYWQPLSLSVFCNHQIVVSITVSSSIRSNINNIWMPSFVYQDLTNQIEQFSIMWSPFLLTNVAMLGHCILDNTFFHVAKFITLIPSSLLFHLNTHTRLLVWVYLFSQYFYWNLLT